ncbi:MAG TPA: hypothetical protein VK024_02830 [Actinomycetaceae bacterium]|nr:hypothetical protein [Actinomycetaceae bacterium]
MGIDAQVEEAGRNRRTEVRLGLLVASIFALVCLAPILYAIVTLDGERLARAAGGCWALAMLAPVLVIGISALRRRGPGGWLWVSTGVGAAIAAAGPIIMLAAGGAQSATLLPSRRSVAELSLGGFGWLSAATALALLIVTFIGYRYHRRHGARQTSPAPNL